MSVYRSRGPGGRLRWRYRTVATLPDGSKERISGTPTLNTRDAAVNAERDHLKRLGLRGGTREPAPTLAEWFDGRFWTEWVIGEGNRKGTQTEKQCLFDHHLRESLGHIPLDEIDQAAVQRLKAELATKPGKGRDAEGKPLPMAPKSRANVLAVLSKALRYAEEAEVIERAPRIKLGKFERPEIVAWEFPEYARLVAAAAREGAEWHAATLLAGEAGLRVGEILALTWEDLDLVAGTVTVARSIYQGHEGPTKGGRARKVPMTATLHGALTSLATIRRGRVVRAPGGEDISEGLVKGHRAYRICRLAGLPERSWHTLRHTFATHAAQLGVNPWRLQAWLGHSSIQMTMRYVHHAETHRRATPNDVLTAGAEGSDPDERIVAMLGARAGADYEQRGNHVPTVERSSGNSATSRGNLVRAIGIEDALSIPRKRRP